MCKTNVLEILNPRANHTCDVEVGRTAHAKRINCPKLATIQINQLHLCDRHAEVAMEHVCGRETNINRDKIPTTKGNL